MRVICVWNCRFYKRAQSNDPLNVSLWFWVVKFIIWMLVLEILLKKKSLIVLVTTLSLAVSFKNICLQAFPVLFAFFLLQIYKILHAFLQAALYFFPQFPVQQQGLFMA